MFEAPRIYTRIPDISQMYAINEKQCEELDKNLDEMDDNIFLDSMHESRVARWEKVLKIIPYEDDTPQERRFRVKTKVMERLPYSVRVIKSKLSELCPDGYEFEMSSDKQEVMVTLSLESSRVLSDVADYLETTLPLNIIYTTRLVSRVETESDLFAAAVLFKDVKKRSMIIT